MWGVEAKVIPVIIGAHATVKVKRYLRIPETIPEISIQKSVLLGTVEILRTLNLLDIW